MNHPPLVTNCLCRCWPSPIECLATLSILIVSTRVSLHFPIIIAPTLYQSHPFSNLHVSCVSVPSSPDSDGHSEAQTVSLCWISDCLSELKLWLSLWAEALTVSLPSEALNVSQHSEALIVSLSWSSDCLCAEALTVSAHWSSNCHSVLWCSDYLSALWSSRPSSAPLTLSPGSAPVPSPIWSLVLKTGQKHKRHVNYWRGVTDKV